MGWAEKIVLVLAALGAINWGLFALNFELVGKLISTWAPDMVTNIVYYVIALCGIWALIKAFK